MTDLSMRRVRKDHPMIADSTAEGAPPVCSLRLAQCAEANENSFKKL
jgi:hypothetical protein